MSFNLELVYDDITLFSRQVSTIKSRFDSRISLKTNVYFDGNEIEMGILMSAPMIDVSGPEMCNFLAEEGHVGVMHRFASPEWMANSIVEILSKNNFVSFSVGVNDSEEKLSAISEKVIEFYSKNNLKDRKNILICIDTANGSSELVLRAIEKINQFKENIKKSVDVGIEMMAGNIVTSDAASFLYKNGVKFVRVGIGGGSVCTTPMVTGIFRPVVSSIVEISEFKKENSIEDFYIIADGGIRGAADVMKAIAVGADFVMMGNLFAGFKESNGDVFKDTSGNSYKMYRGMASFQMAELNNSLNGLNKKIIPEGVISTIKYKGEIKPWFDEFIGSINSCMSYCNALTIDDFRVNVEVVRCSTNSNYLRQPHQLNK